MMIYLSHKKRYFYRRLSYSRYRQGKLSQILILEESLTLPLPMKHWTNYMQQIRRQSP